MTDWRTVLKDGANGVYQNEDVEKFPLEFDPLPGKKVQKKIDFFFLPYNYD
jgi:hypothetical protein|tara:strand:+ start:126 stop:278 length:153 start_codon:yes stop_codon:yes gene_type:complete